MRVVWVGARACLVEVEDAVAAASLAAWSRARGLRSEEVVPAAATVLFDGTDPDEVSALLRHWSPDAADLDGPLVRVPVDYSGPDLEDVAGHWGCSVDEVVRIHTSVELVALFSGFAPGFSYLAGLPAERAVPRRSSPRARVPAGSVGLADTWCGIYPTASPGGWLLLGTTDVPLWDVAREQPALLAPGTRVRFEVRG
ncbi:KipI family sensor histidine kinase inhibitor [Nocardioides cavernae]|uniref:KipI family sensor histidine kinase inhibitor n=1 Tax=Nocardioides cavernae TaxID=1921566 RepID=A0A7Y9KUG8_9ACTN|nr:allophanate hydrolase subunit 1 [Nocardioides cavernae]NYE37888.1 KipI family sensor histidine kinase inhibitor [Nocardioides cavernae]